MTYRALGDLVHDVVERCARLGPVHLWIRANGCLACRKNFIMELRSSGSITDEEAEMLIEIYELEAA